MEKVLIITYYWPPSGGAGVQRWLKFVKYLREFEFEPIVYTVENGEYPEIDSTLEMDIPANLVVIRKKIWEPYHLYKWFIGNKKQKISASFMTEKKKPSLLEKISVFIRGNLFIPDARRFWIRPSVRFLSKYIQENKIDKIISSGPPHSLHLIALKLKKKLNIKWVADFRDPWTNIDYYDQLKTTRWADQQHFKLQQKTLDNADAVVVVGKNMKDEFEVLGAKNVQVITNGFDRSDKPETVLSLDDFFSLAHFGTIMKNRNPEGLWRAISSIVSENDRFRDKLRIKLVGRVDHSVMTAIENCGLNQYIEKIEYLPHNKVIEHELQSQVLLLLINNSNNAKGMLTGKFYEYLLAYRPILIVGPTDGDAANILNELHAGITADFDDIEGIKSAILTFFEKYESGTLRNPHSDIQKYSRYELTRKLADVLSKI